MFKSVLKIGKIDKIKLELSGIYYSVIEHLLDYYPSLIFLV